MDSLTEIHDSPGSFWGELFAMLGTNLRFSTVFSPQTNGQSERINWTLVEVLRECIDSETVDWDLQLPLVQHALNPAVAGGLNIHFPNVKRSIPLFAGPLRVGLAQGFCWGAHTVVHHGIAKLEGSNLATVGFTIPSIKYGPTNRERFLPVPGVTLVETLLVFKPRKGAGARLEKTPETDSQLLSLMRFSILKHYIERRELNSSTYSACCGHQILPCAVVFRSDPLGPHSLIAEGTIHKDSYHGEGQENAKVCGGQAHA